MKPIEYRFSGGPLDGQTMMYEGTASWWGMRYDRDGIKGEYNTRPYGETPWGNDPYALYWWEEGTPREMKPDWELPEEALEEHWSSEAFEDHVRRLLDGEQGR